MSKLRTPREKKLASLALDGRNVYGKNDKASRKSIPKGKQRSHKALRKAASEPLMRVSSALPEDELDIIEAAAKSREISAKRNAFRKQPDVSLGAVVEYQQTGDFQKMRRNRPSKRSH